MSELPRELNSRFSPLISQMKASNVQIDGIKATAANQRQQLDETTSVACNAREMGGRHDSTLNTLCTKSGAGLMSETWWLDNGP